MTIDGKPEEGFDSFTVLNPATEEPCGVAPECTEELLDAAMLAARRAQPSWAANESARRELLHASAQALVAKVDSLAATLTAEQGKPLAESVREVHASAYWFSYFAGLDTSDVVLQDDEEALVTTHRVPLGVVAAITPWNYPLLLAAWKVAPALLAGNTVVLKPSPFTPLSTLLLGQVLADVLPPGVLNVISGGDGLGPMVTHHSVPAKISFTGSTQTGRRVAAAASPALKRLTLELGGNDAAIVLDDAEPASIAKAIFASAFSNNGQTCAAIKRLYVPAAKYDEMVDALVAIANTRAVGAGDTPGSQLGPLSNAPQRERVAELVQDAVSRGARVACGGQALPGKGYFYAPTILADVPADARVVLEEQFGPVLPVLPYESLEDAIREANGTEFGLGGSVWGSDVDWASVVASRLECGTAWVNAHTRLDPAIPFSGFKSSGLGVENGLAGYHEFTDLQTRHVVRGGKKQR